MSKSLLLLLCLLGVCGSVAQTPSPSATSSYVPVTDYDANRNAAQDLKAAEVEAMRTGKRVLMQVGGSGAWCDWCHFMDTFFQAHPDLIQLRDRNFVTVKISVSAENQNREVLSKYPKIYGYPHFFVLDDKGNLIHSQPTSPLEMGQGNTYNADRVKEFLVKWGEQRDQGTRAAAHSSSQP